MADVPASFPTQAQVMIIGGGVIGCSTAYHLGKLGWKDVVLLERKQLTSGTTRHAAGLVVSGGFAYENLLSMAHYTRELYINLEMETGVSTGFKPVGYLQIASSQTRLRALRRNANFVRSFGITIDEISPKEFKVLWPLADITGVVAGFYTPKDSRSAEQLDWDLSKWKGVSPYRISRMPNSRSKRITAAYLQRLRSNRFMIRKVKGSGVSGIIGTGRTSPI